MGLGDIELLERLNHGERFEGSSVCDSAEERLGGMEEGFEMVELLSSSSSSPAVSISDDGWAVVPEHGSRPQSWLETNVVSDQYTLPVLDMQIAAPIQPGSNMY